MKNEKTHTACPDSSNFLMKSVMYDYNPNIIVIFSKDLKVIDCNSRALSFFQFESKEDLSLGLLQLINESVPEYQPTGRKSIPFSERFRTVFEKEVIEFDTELIVNSRSIIFHAILKRVPYKDSFAVAAYITERQDNEERIRIMLDSTPLACVFINKDYQITDCNMKAVHIAGFTSKEELISCHKSIIPERQPDGQNSIKKLRAMINETYRTGHTVFNFTYKISGENLPLELTMIRVKWKDSYVISSYARDLKTLVKAQEELSLHSRLLLSVNIIANELFDATPDMFDDVINKSLRIIGTSLNVDRTYIWQNFEKDGKLHSRQIYEYSENAEPQQGKDFTASMSYDDCPNWKKSIFAGKIINGPIKNLLEPERSILGIQQILSVLIIPIYIHGEPWGFIGFDDCHSERSFEKAIEQVLQSCGILIVSAILRNEMTIRLIDAKNELSKQDKLRHSVNDVANLLLETNQGNFNEAVYQSLMTLGTSVNAGRVSIWKNNNENDVYVDSVCLLEWNLDESNNKNLSGFRFDFSKKISNWGVPRENIEVSYSDLGELTYVFEGLKDFKSFLLIPLYVHGDFWGFVNFSYRKENPSFNEAEKNILNSGGMLIASAIIRNEINEKLVEAKENALASIKAKSEFLSRMSHEIRTPMNAIISMTLLAKKSDNLKKIHHYLETVDASSWQLMNIINDVLDMSKIDANKLEFNYAEFNFEKIIKHVLNVVQIKIEEKKQNFTFDFPQMFSRNIISDELRLSQVLINLISNAVKFTPEYGDIVLRVRETKIDENQSLLRVEIADTGIGIPPEMLPNIFNSFEQGDGSITRKYGGTGLGLAICRQIITLMGGEIWAESSPGKGSSFIFEITVKWGGKNSVDNVAMELRSGLRILVVDDTPDVLGYFKSVFENFSLDCDTALNGSEAIRLVSEQSRAGTPYDVIFIDWYMPFLNGGETACEIKKIVGENVVVIMISSADWIQIEKEAAEFKIHYFLQKPILVSDLYNMLLRLTGTQISNDEANAENVYNWSDKRILLAEDVDINREIVAAILEETGVSIDNAENGKEAIDMYMSNHEKYDLILMDVQMPVLDGISATLKIRSSGLPGSRTIPIIAMTANAFKEDEQASLKAGMNGHMTKPIDIPAMFHTLKNWLE